MNAGQWIVVSLAAFTCVVAVVIAATDLYRMWREDRDAKRLERLLKIVDELHRHDAQDFRVLAEGSGKSTLVSEIDLTEPKGRKRLGIPEEEK